MTTNERLPTRVQVAIVGGGPAGLLLARKLSRSDIDCAIIERHSRQYVMSRIRAGVLEQGSVDQLREAGLGARIDEEGLVHEGCEIADDEGSFRLDFLDLAGKTVTVYGQTEVTRDLYSALEDDGVVIADNSGGVEIDGIESGRPVIAFQRRGRDHAIKCDFVAGCDGFHGVSRNCIPERVRTTYERSFGFGWLGMLSESPPVNHELVYCRSGRGFALASMRSPCLSRYYLQVPLGDRVEDWDDDRFWKELALRIPVEISHRLQPGRTVEKSITPIRSFVSEPMSWGWLFLCGDSSHIVPPTGAKGLNLALSDVHYLHAALVRRIHGGDDELLNGYSQTALARVWKSMRFSWWMTNLLHLHPGMEAFEQRVQDAEFAQLRDTRLARQIAAENYTGLGY